MTLEAKERALALQAETNKTILPQVADPKADLKAERAKVPTPQTKFHLLC